MTGGHVTPEEGGGGGGGGGINYPASVPLMHAAGGIFARMQQTPCRVIPGRIQNVCVI